jgi:hypothetical protein
MFLSLLAGCKKYSDDENSIHLRTAKERLCQPGGWCPSYEQGCNGITFFKEDGTVNEVYFLMGSDFTWNLIDHRNKLRFTNSSNNITYDFTIIRLERESDGRPVLWLKNDTATFYFIEHKD